MSSRRTSKISLLAAVFASALLAQVAPFASAHAEASPPASETASPVAHPYAINGGAAHAPGATPQTTNISGPYAPSQIQSMYGITASDLANASGTLVAIVDANIPHDVESALAYYRNAFGLPACTRANGCLVTTDQFGSPIDPSTTAISADPNWRFETLMDVEAVSAACPTCRIMVLDSASANMDDLDRAVSSAVAGGAMYVSMSYGVGEWSGQTSEDAATYANHAVTFVAASGDSGYNNGSVSYPASSPLVVAAGGTSVTRSNAAWNISAWNGAGSGCSAYSNANSAQASNSALVAACHGKAAAADVSALADPNTGLQIYNPSSSGSWWSGGGTSLASPLITTLYAIAGNHTSPFQPYATAAAHPGFFSDVVGGTTSTCPGGTICTATAGWDGPTGVGTPLAPAALSASGTGTVPPPDQTTNGDNGATPPSLGNLPLPNIGFHGRPRIDGAVRRKHRVRADYDLSITGMRTSASVPVKVTWLLGRRKVAVGNSVKVRPGWVGQRLSYRIAAGSGDAAAVAYSPGVRVRR